MKKKFSERIRGGGKKAFWLWIGYQSLKGILTLSLIWIPLALAWWGAR